MQRRDHRSGPGRLTIIGLGPGDTALLPPMALKALHQAQVVVGYKTYIDLIDPQVLKGHEVLITGMTKEIDRVLAAVRKAQEGFDVAVVSSGDSGIYGMSGLALEILEQQDLLDSIEFDVIPGIPALAAGAALLGAPLMHDFAVVSLSDLMTTWETIENRLEHAAAADFNIVIYNPRSKRRDWQLPRALEIITGHRSAQTPVGLVRKAFRPDQAVSVTPLKDFDPAQVDMLSILFVGNSDTRAVGQRMLTPRGYTAKYGPAS